MNIYRRHKDIMNNLEEFPEIAVEEPQEIIDEIPCFIGNHYQKNGLKYEDIF